MAKKKKSKTSSANGAAASPSSSRGVVGPDYVQVLSGTLSSKSLRLVLCGESHTDAIDVTRRGGGIIREGWVDTDIVELTGEMVGKFGGIDDDIMDDDGGGGGDRDESRRRGSSVGGIRVRAGICKRNNKLLPMGKAMEWGRDVGGNEIEYIPPGREMVMLWVPSRDGGCGGTTRGRSYVVELFLDDENDGGGGGSGNDEDDDDDGGGGRGGREDRSRAHLPPDVVALLDRMTDAARLMGGGRGAASLSGIVRDLKDGKVSNFAVDDGGCGGSGGGRRALFQWADSDDAARSLNRRRLLGDVISEDEHDGLIRDRARALRSSGENVWTWDDWLAEVASKLSDDGGAGGGGRRADGGDDDDDDDVPSLHLVLESSIPPWEVEICRDGIMPEFEHAMASDCVRCISEDSDISEMDAHDPSSDGFGSYIDYVHRRFMRFERAMIATAKNGGNGGGEEEGVVIASSGFMHCVDCRDLGCKQACIDETLRGGWMGLLDPGEGSGSGGPPWGRSPEEVELERLRIGRGVLYKSDHRVDGDDDDGGKEDGEPLDDDDDDASSDDDLVAFPSMEKFFGQCTDVMYYAPNYKVAYAPFLGRSVKSIDNWNTFFAELFLGGTVVSAVNMLDLSVGGDLHVRSPIVKIITNEETGECELRKRIDEEHEVSLPLLPIKAFLKARGSEPARTWSSDLFASLLECDCQELRDMAIRVREWALDDIAKHAADPKLSDDDIGGGEWFLAYLRQCHREM
jgi:hypothetical protein